MSNSLQAQQEIVVRHASDISAARRCGQQMATELGFDETRAGRLAIMINEAATNILKHAGEGSILLKPVSGEVNAIEVLAIDRGPGIYNLQRALQDGMSTSGTQGNGLGALKRLADTFDVYSKPDKGTAFFIRIAARDGERAPAGSIDVGTVCIPVAGESVCGDAWSVRSHDTAVVFSVVDGLGHGESAAAAAHAAVEVFDGDEPQTPERLIDKSHTALRITRGAAAAVASLDIRTREMTFAGVGNIAACVIDEGRRKQLISHNGIVGHNMRKVQTVATPCPDGALCIMHSDGITTQWDLDAYPGLSVCHPALIAGVIYRDFHRGRDDATVFVLRHRGLVEEAA